MVINAEQSFLLDSLNTAVVVLDGDQRLDYLNPAAENLLGISQSLIRGETIGSLLWESADLQQELRLASQGQDQYTKREAHWRLSHGDEITVDYSVSTLSPGNWIIIEIQPLDRLMRINQENNLLATQETTRQLVRGMAHEIKNPLGGIRGAAQLMQREVADSPDLTECASIIIEEADRLRNLVDRLLGPNQPPQYKLQNIHEALERVLSLIKVESDGRVKMIRDYDPSIPEFEADNEQLIQALLNVVRNAMQALIESDTPDANIRLRTRIQRQYTIGMNHTLVCRVDIMDNGPGIPEKIIKDIFYPMISGRAEGTGLGLPISQNIINQHGGLIKCESLPNNTQFSIFLPLEQNHA